MLLDRSINYNTIFLILLKHIFFKRTIVELNYNTRYTDWIFVYRKSKRVTRNLQSEYINWNYFHLLMIEIMKGT